MRLVIASAFDVEAAGVVAAWGADARLLTPADLAAAGWVHRPGDSRGSSAVVGGDPVAYSEITGAWSLMPRVLEQELVQIVPDERRYVAAEMTAFLVAFLAELPGHVVNRAAGPWMATWPAQRWRWEARSLGLPTIEANAAAVEKVTVVGGRAIGRRQQTLAAERLAAGLGLDLLTVTFSEGSVVAASLRPPLRDLAVTAAVGALLCDLL